MKIQALLVLLFISTLNISCDVEKKEFLGNFSKTKYCEDRKNQNLNISLDKIPEGLREFASVCSSITANDYKTLGSQTTYYKCYLTAHDSNIPKYAELHPTSEELIHELNILFPDQGEDLFINSTQSRERYFTEADFVPASGGIIPTEGYQPTDIPVSSNNIYLFLDLRNTPQVLKPRELIKEDDLKEDSILNVVISSLADNYNYEYTLCNEEIEVYKTDKGLTIENFTIDICTSTINEINITLDGEIISLGYSEENKGCVVY